eukprot:TRINITY_DN5001_c0_g1_i1.p2 TRINITY_DN5001_c0_g1~~TRINITY_DN5001_c0_g1_i1.p2  ORF type:complete len:114 (+),score=13.16 TRINITY_DN5001_c0_g1_i1:389-730(+)
MTPWRSWARRAHRCNCRSASCCSCGSVNGRKYSVSLMRPRNSSRLKAVLRMGCTTVFVKSSGEVVLRETLRPQLQGVVGDLPLGEVGRHHERRLLAVDGLPLAVGQAPLVEHL